MHLEGIRRGLSKCLGQKTENVLPGCKFLPPPCIPPPQFITTQATRPLCDLEKGTLRGTLSPVGTRCSTLVQKKKRKAISLSRDNPGPEHLAQRQRKLGFSLRWPSQLAPLCVHKPCDCPAVLPNEDSRYREWTLRFFIWEGGGCGARGTTIP